MNGALSFQLLKYINNVNIKRISSKRSLKYEKIIFANLRKYNKTKEKIYKIIIKNLMFHKKSHYTSIP